jgi:hypothetical protein
MALTHGGDCDTTNGHVFAVHDEIDKQDQQVLDLAPPIDTGVESRFRPFIASLRPFLCTRGNFMSPAQFVHFRANHPKEFYWVLCKSTEL